MILFDLDGTLIDSNGIWEDIDLEFLSRNGLTPTEEYAYTVGQSNFPGAAEFTRQYFHLDLTAQEIMDQWMVMGEVAYRQVPLKEGAAAFLAQCAARGEPMALLTACAPKLCHTALERHGFSPYFKELILAEELGLEKRNPEVYRLAAERLGVHPEDCVFYEDAPANCVAAKTAGITVVGVYDQFYKKYRDEMERCCDGYIMSFAELLG